MMKGLVSNVKKMIKKGFFKKVIQGKEHRGISLYHFMLFFCSVVIIRLAQQWWINGFVEDTFYGQFITFAETFLVFLSVAVALMLLWSYILKESVEKIAPIVVSGMLLMLVAPIFDIFRADIDMTYYEITDLQGLLYAFVTIFGETPNIGITIGYRVEIIIASVFAFVYARMHKKGYMQSGVMAFGTYSIFFFVSAFPSIIGLITQSFTKNILEITHIDNATLFLTSHDVLVRGAMPVVQTLLFHVSILYVSILTALVSIFFYIHYKPLAKEFIQRVWGSALLLYLQVYILGMTTGMMVAQKNMRDIIDGDIFAIAAVLAVTIGIIAYACASIIQNTKIKKRRDIQMMLYGGGIFFLALVHEKLAIVAICALAVRVIRFMPPLKIAQIPILSEITAAIELLAIAMIGAMSMQLDIPLLTNSSVTVYFMAVFVCMVVTYSIYTNSNIFITYYERNKTLRQKAIMRMGVAWFGVYIAGINIYNVFDKTFLAMVCATISFGMLQKWRKAEREKKDRVFAVISTVFICFVSVLMFF